MAFPTTGILDDFNRANETPIAAPWTNKITPTHGDLNLTSNTLKSAAAGQGSAWWTTSTFGPGVEVFATIPTADATENIRLDLWLRLINPGTASASGYRLRLLVSGGDYIFQVLRTDNTINTQLGADITVSYTAGDSIGMSAIGDTLTAYLTAAGVYVSQGTRTDPTYSAAGNIGVGIENTTWVVDNFGGGTIGAATAADNPPIGFLGRGAGW